MFTDNTSKVMQDTAPEINFRPFTVLLGIILGTLFAIAFGLAVVCLVFWILREEEPRVMAELGSLLISTAIFWGLSGLAALSFWGSLRSAAWRYLPMAMLWGGIFLAGQYYWPDS